MTASQRTKPGTKKGVRVGQGHGVTFEVVVRKPLDFVGQCRVPVLAELCPVASETPHRMAVEILLKVSAETPRVEMTSLTFCPRLLKGHSRRPL